MHSFLKALLVVLVLATPALIVRASESAAPPATTGQVAAPAPMKFSQQLVSGVNPEWERLTPGYSALSPLPVRGQSMYYNPGVMQKVITYRKGIRQINDCAECIGYVALLRSGDINRKIWLQVNESTVEGPFLVTDVAARHDIPRLLRIGWGIDVDWETAKRWGMRMPMVTIWDSPPSGMVINSSAPYRASLEPIAAQFNEIQPWTPSSNPVVMAKPASINQPAVAQPSAPQPDATNPNVQVKLTNNQVGRLVQGIIFKPGPFEIRVDPLN